MAHAGYFDRKELLTLRQFGSRLQGHPERTKLPGLENTSGPLGCGLSQACGMALALRMNKQNHRWVYVTVGDGERRRARYFPDRLPIGIHLSGRGVLVYVVLDPTLNDFRLFLERHSAVLRALPAWTVRVVVPPQFADFALRVKQAFFTQLATPALTPQAIAEVRQRFESVQTQHYRFDFGPTDCYVENRDALAAPRYHVLFKRWKKEGDAALVGLASSAIHDAMQTEAGRIETLELGHRYGHLSPLAAVS